MRKLHWQSYLAATLVLIVILAACGDGGGDSAPPTQEPQTGFAIKPGLAGLEGTWHIVGVNTGDAANGEWYGWVEGRVTINLAGQLSNYMLQYDDGTIETIPKVDRLWISKDGIVTTSNDPNFYGALSLDQDTVVVTYTDVAGGYTMLLLQKSPSTVSGEDFQGDWYEHGVAAGDAPAGWTGWQRATMAISSSGRIDFESLGSDGYSASGYANLQLNDGALQDAYSSLYLSRDGQMIVGRETEHSRDSGRKAYVLNTLLRGGGAFAQSDLQGYWSFHVLSAGDAPQVNGWGHGMMQVDPAGKSLVNWQAWSDATTVLDADTLSLDASGVITSTAISSFRGKLSRGKDTITATFSNSSGSGSLLIGLRRNVPPVDVVPEESASTSAVIGAGGGSLQATGSDGTAYELTIPAGAVDADVNVKMTPISGVDKLPVSGGHVAAVQFAPEGLHLNAAAVLVITSPNVTNPVDLVAYQYSDGIFHFVPLYPTSVSATASSVVVSAPIWHFSASGLGTGTPTEITYPDFGSVDDSFTLLARYKNQLAALTKTAAENGGSTAGYTGEATAILDLALHAILNAVQKSNSVEKLHRSVYEYITWLVDVQFWGVGDYFFNLSSDAGKDVEEAIKGNIDPRIERLEALCMSNCTPKLFLDGTYGPLECDVSNICFKRPAFMEALPWIKENRNLRMTLFNGLTDHSPSTFCAGIGNELASKVEIAPGYVHLKSGEGATLTGEMTTLLGRTLPVTNWRSVPSSTATVAPTVDGLASVHAFSEGVALVYGSDSGYCEVDSAVVQVDDPMNGFWNVSVASRRNDICDPLIPLAALPGGLATIRIDASNGDASWVDRAPPGFVMSGTITDNIAAVSGGSPVDLAQQGCEIRQTELDRIVGECRYVSYANPLHVCSGRWDFRGKRQ